MNSGIELLSHAICCAERSIPQYCCISSL
jgi:hypothetical protein